MDETKRVNGIFSSIWDCGKIVTDAILDIETGQIETKPVEEEYDLGSLIREEFVDDFGNSYDICEECHEYILYDFREDIDGIKPELTYCCKNPDCSGHNV